MSCSSLYIQYTYASFSSELNFVFVCVIPKAQTMRGKASARLRNLILGAVAKTDFLVGTAFLNSFVVELVFFDFPTGQF